MSIYELLKACCNETNIKELEYKFLVLLCNYI